MTPNELRQQADSLLQRGLFRRAANVLQLITTHRKATEADRDRAQADAGHILAKHCQLAEAVYRDKINRAQSARRAAARETAKVTTGKLGDGMRASQERHRQQWKSQQSTA
ncbi:hypothetical protein [Citrobacter gillenii]|uniref:hypothetical protein n=1 Tax=Citrobacter gillenii TaxID=67828 RepID=UPI0039877065